MNLVNFLLVLAVLIVAVLSVIAARLVSKLHRVNKLRDEKLAALAKANEESLRVQRAHINKSIQILARALHQDELTLTEASIRISHLLDQLDVAQVIREEFSAFYQLREHTEHIPILAQWQNLSAKEQHEFDKQRVQQEATYHDFVMDAAKRIIGRAF